MEVCCICLEEVNNNNNNIKFTCCKQHIHKQCFFLLVLNGYNNCPMCRSQINLFSYFDEKALEIHYGMMDQSQRYIYYYAYQEIQYQISKTQCNRFKVIRFHRLLSRKFMFVLLIFAIYLSLMFIIIMEHMNNERGIRETANHKHSLQYYDMING